MTWSDHCRINFKTTARNSHSQPCPSHPWNSPFKTLDPWLVVGFGTWIYLPPRLSASWMKQPFFSYWPLSLEHQLSRGEQPDLGWEPTYVQLLHLSHPASFSPFLQLQISMPAPKKYPAYQRASQSLLPGGWNFINVFRRNVSNCGVIICEKSRLPNSAYGLISTRTDYLSTWVHMAGSLESARRLAILLFVW